MKFPVIQALTLTLILPLFSEAQNVNLNGISKNFVSPNKVNETCIAPAKLPIGNYSEKDIETEEKLCSMDFYAGSIALCPKTWSTSPGTMVYELEGAFTPAQVTEIERTQCVKNNSLKTLGKFKQTMNQSGTSGTFSMSSIMYYHLSRALDTVVTVPVAVYRSMDIKAHLARVTSKAKPAATAKMNVAGWKYLKDAETSPEKYNQISDLITSHNDKIYGVLLQDKGNRYGAEINGTRASGWGQGQSNDFQKTPAFLANRSEKPLAMAIKEGYDLAVKDPKMKTAVPVRPSDLQMLLWMNETAEIAIMDHCMSQQDRVGNIDFSWYWAFENDQGAIVYKKVDPKFKDFPPSKKSLIQVPAELANLNPELIERTSIGDNDAGGLIPYANFSKKTGMVANLRHLRRDLYERIQTLAKDFQSQGANFMIMATEMSRVPAFQNKNSNRISQLINNLKEVAAILKNNKDQGLLQLHELNLSTED